MCIRRDYLTGFHKRKLERQRKGREQLEKKIREEKLRKRQEVPFNALLVAFLVLGVNSTRGRVSAEIDVFRVQIKDRVKELREITGVEASAVGLDGKG